MSAVDALRMAQENGIRIGVLGTDLILDAEREPSPRVLETIRRHKASIVTLLTAAEGDWTADDWQALFDERAGIAEFDGGLTRPEAEAQAYESCIAEWLNGHPRRSDSGGCAWCGKPIRDGRSIVPFAFERHGSTWLHPECWNDWHRRRRQMASRALAAIGLVAPPEFFEGHQDGE